MDEVIKGKIVMKQLTKQDLKDNMVPGIKYHHQSWAFGYVSRKLEPSDIKAHPYIGQYGIGFITYSPSYRSTRYHITEYWIADKDTSTEVLDLIHDMLG